MVAAEHERHDAVSSRPHHERSHPFAGSLDRVEIPGPWIADLGRLGDINADVAPVDPVTTEARDPLMQAGVADRGGAHADTAAACSEVEPGADHRDRTFGLPSFHRPRLTSRSMGGSIRSLAAAEPFTTKDGSTIHELHHTAAQSLAEAAVSAAGVTVRHRHARSEEIYFLLAGEGELEIDGVVRRVLPGDAALIVPGAWHQITATTDLRFLCCCAPPYSHEDTYFE